MTVLGTIGRLLLVPLAFVLAGFAAGFVLVTLGLERVTHAVNGDFTSEDGIVSVFAMFTQGVAIASAFSLIPALLMIVIGEVARIRSLLYYMVAGGISLIAAPVLAGVADSGIAALPASSVLQVSATAGFFGGFVYWLLAGRTA